MHACDQSVSLPVVNHVDSSDLKRLLLIECSDKASHLPSNLEQHLHSHLSLQNNTTIRRPFAKDILLYHRSIIVLGERSLRHWLICRHSLLQGISPTLCLLTHQQSINSWSGVSLINIFLIPCREKMTLLTRQLVQPAETSPPKVSVGQIQLRRLSRKVAW